MGESASPLSDTADFVLHARRSCVSESINTGQPKAGDVMFCHLQKLTNLTQHNMLIGIIRLHDQTLLQIAKNSADVSCAFSCMWQPMLLRLKCWGTLISRHSGHTSCAHRWQMQRLLRALAQSVGSAGRYVRDGWAQCLLKGPHDWSCPASHPLQALPLCHWQECSHDPSHTKPGIIMRECLACHVHCVMCAERECRVMRCRSCSKAMTVTKSDFTQWR